MNDRGSGVWDVYLSSREFGGKLHVSMHGTGRWHLAFASEHFSALFEGQDARPSRFVETWDAPAPFAPGLVLACQVLIPYSAVDFEDAARPTKVHWVESAEPGHAIEIAILFSAFVEAEGAWPGRDSMGTKYVAHALLGDGAVYAVAHSTAYETPPPQKVPAESVRYFAGHGESDLFQPKGMRMLDLAMQENGALRLIDTGVTITK